MSDSTLHIGTLASNNVNMHSINFYNFEETGKGSSKKSTGKTKSCTKRISK